MSQNFTINGTVYPFPDVDEQEWGQDVTDWASAVTSGMLQKAGGAFTLTADVDFGASYGVLSIYYKSRAANPASAGVVRLGNTEIVAWRNAANDGDMTLAVDASDDLVFSGNMKAVSFICVAQASAPSNPSSLPMIYYNSTDGQYYGYKPGFGTWDVVG